MNERDPGMENAPYRIDLPCGAIGYLDGCGHRCDQCMAIWGSMACACSTDMRKAASEEKVGRRPRES